MDACPLLITSIVAVKPEDQGTFFQDFLGLSGYLCSIGGFYSNTALLRTRNAQNHNEAQRLAFAKHPVGMPRMIVAGYRASMGGTRQRYVDGTNSKPRKRLGNALRSVPPHHGPGVRCRGSSAKCRAISPVHVRREASRTAGLCWVCLRCARLTKFSLSQFYFAWTCRSFHCQ
jgi:hypothetical protein